MLTHLRRRRHLQTRDCPRVARSLGRTSLCAPSSDRRAGGAPSCRQCCAALPGPVCSTYSSSDLLYRIPARPPGRPLGQRMRGRNTDRSLRLFLPVDITRFSWECMEKWDRIEFFQYNKLNTGSTPTPSTLYSLSSQSCHDCRDASPKILLTNFERCQSVSWPFSHHNNLSLGLSI